MNEDINIDEYKNNPRGLFEKLLEIRQQEIRSNDKRISKIIIELNKNKEVDFCELGIQAMKAGFSCFDINHILEDAIPFLSLNIKSTFEYLKGLYNSMQGDLAAGTQYTPIANLTNEQPQFARELLNALIDSGEIFIVGYVSTIFENFAKTGIEDIHNELLTLISHTKEPVVQGVVFALGNLKYDVNINNELLKKTLAAFDELLEKKSDAINQAIASSLGSLYSLDTEVRSRLMLLAKRGEPQTCYKISYFLFLQYKNINDDKWFEEILMTFSAISCQYKGIISHVDYILSGLLKDKKNFELVERFFTAWLLNSDYHPNQQKLDSLFGATLSKMIRQSIFFNTLITKYLNHDDYKLHQAASDLIQYSNLHTKRTINLDQIIIQSLDIEDILYICKKILGYIFDVNTICSLVYSVLTAKPNDIKVKDLVQDIFAGYIGMDYPSTTLEFLRNKLTTSALSDELKGDLKNIIDAIESRQKIFQSLPRLKELSIPQKCTYQIALEESKKNNKLMEEAQKGSIVSKIATKISLKYGISCFSYRDGKYSVPNILSSFSYSVELPRSEIFNPVSASMQRVSFRLAKRGEK